MIVIHHDKDAILSPRAYVDTVDIRNAIGWKATNYLVGRKPPNYPVPARYHVALDESYSDVFVTTLLRPKVFYS